MMSKREDSIEPVAKALSLITEADPRELAQYVRILVSSTSGNRQNEGGKTSNVRLVSEIGAMLVEDDMVTVKGKKLEDALTDALRCIGIEGGSSVNRSNPNTTNRAPIHRQQRINRNINQNHYKNRNNRRNDNFPQRQQQSSSVRNFPAVGPPPPQVHSVNHNHRKRVANSNNQNHPVNRQKLHPPPHNNIYPKYPPPPPKSRTLLLSNMPSITTKGDLYRFFKSKNVHVTSLRLTQEASSISALVELQTQDQAMFILHSPDPIMGNRFIGIQLYHSDINSSYNHSKKIPLLPPPPPPRNPPPPPPPQKITPNHPHEKPNANSSTNIPESNASSDKSGNSSSNVESKNQQQRLELIKQEQSLLQKQISLSKKLLQKFTKEKEKTLLLQKIKSYQTRYNTLLTLQKEAYSSLLQETSSSEKTHSQPAPIHPDLTDTINKYRLDNRTTTLSIKVPATDNHETIIKELETHFTKFGTISNLERNTTEENHDDTNNESFFVTFSNRHQAEQAKINGTKLNETTELDLSWYNLTTSTTATTIITQNHTKLTTSSVDVPQSQLDQESPLNHNSQEDKKHIDQPSFADSMKPEEDENLHKGDEIDINDHDQIEDDGDDDERWR